MALEFGADDYIAITDDGTYDLNNPITVEFWIKSDGIVDDGGAYYRLVFELDDDSNATTISFVPIGWSGSVYAMMINSGAPNYAAWLWASRTDHPLWDGEWHHVAFVTNDTPANCLCYVDGVSLGAPDITGGTIPDPTSTDDVYIGCGGGPANFLGAGNTRHLDEVRIWSDARTATEIKTWMHRRLPGDIGENLVSIFRLDEPAGTVAYDLLNGPDGTLTNFPATPWEGGQVPYFGRGPTAVL